MKRLSILLTLVLALVTGNAVANGEPDFEALKARIARGKTLLESGNVDAAKVDLDYVYNSLKGRTFKSATWHKGNKTKSTNNESIRKTNLAYDDICDLYNKALHDLCILLFRKTGNTYEMARYGEKGLRVTNVIKDRKTSIIGHENIYDIIPEYYKENSYLNDIYSEYKEKDFNDFDIRVYQDGKAEIAEGGKDPLDLRMLLLVNYLDASQYWTYYFNAVAPNGDRKRAAAQKPQFDLTQLYGSYPELAKVLIDVMWLEEGVDEKYYIYNENNTTIHKPRLNQQRGAFSKLCASDRDLAIKYARYCGNNKRLAEALAPTRPEEAYQIDPKEKYKPAHHENLRKWGFKSEEEYKAARNSYGSWDTFYKAMAVREKENAEEYRAQKRRDAEAHNEFIRRTEELEAQRRENNNKVVASYKPRITAALDREDFNGADKLAAEALRQISGGNSYFYYVQALCYYNRVLKFDIEADEDVTALLKAYRSEAERLIELSNRSIHLDSSSTNPAYLYRAMGYFILGNTDKAVRDFRTAMNSHDKGFCYYAIGITYGNAQRYREAVENMKLAHSTLRSSSKYKGEALKHVKKYQEKLDKK